MQFARWAYEFPWHHNHGLRTGAASSYLSYRLGGSASSLNAYGSAKQHSVWLEQAVWSEPQLQWLWRSQYEQMAMHDLEETSGADNDRHAQVLHVGLSLTRTDATGTGRQWLNWDTSLGFLGFNNATAQALDSATADSQGRFNRFKLNTGLQFTENDRLWSINWQAQWANHNLDSTQKMSMGGAHSVRAYTPGVLSGDAGHLLTAEVKHRLEPLSRSVNISGDFYTSVFVDAGWLTLYQAPYASGSNEARLAGAGLGLSWEGPDHWHASLGFSKRVGSAPSQLSGSSYTHDNVWVELVKGFH